jgi:AraC-like DNA-binding protein
MNHPPFYEKESQAPIDRAFPFLLWDSPRAPFWFPLHWHQRMELLYILKGTINAEINGKAWEGNQSDIVTVDAGLIHGFFDSSPDSTVRIFQFGSEIFDETISAPIFSQRPMITSADAALHSHLERLLMEIDSEYRQKDVGFRLVIKAKLYEIVALLLRNVPLEPISDTHGVHKKNNTRLLERIFSCIYNHHENPAFMLEDAANDVGLSKFYLTRFLKEQTGQSFHEHLTRIRVRAAQKHLAGSDAPVTEIAYQSGFPSLASFNRTFRRYTGVCPSLYQHRKTIKATGSAVRTSGSQ